jgi:hypothetical protein
VETSGLAKAHYHNINPTVGAHGVNGNGLAENPPYPVHLAFTPPDISIGIFTKCNFVALMWAGFRRLFQVFSKRHS